MPALRVMRKPGVPENAKHFVGQSTVGLSRVRRGTQVAEGDGLLNR
jgi:hypothetical protein